MPRTARRALLAIASATALTGGLATATIPTAEAATDRNGVCESGEFCYYFNSNHAGSVSDFAKSVGDYGTSQPGCYDFKGPGNGKGECIKNNAASVWNRTGKTSYAYFNSNYGGTSQKFAAGAKVNLNTTLKNNNASHRIGAFISKFWVPFPCGEGWRADTRSGHSPSGYSIDWNHTPDEGWKIHSSAPGTVSRVRDLGNTSYGKYIIIDHGGGWQTLYAHLQSFNVTVGQKVSEKTFIGRVGNSGGSFGAHLHYEQKLSGTVQKATFKSGNPIYYGSKTLTRKTSCP